jgi:LEM-3-like GIY-YIG domain
MKNESDYYVYVYIDPRNNEEFYYGKGRGKRKSAHLLAKGDSAKSERIKEIIKEGERPTIKVIAAGLSEDQAYLVESAFLWKLSKNLTNAVAGVFGSKFRPQNTMHKDLPGFDFGHGIYFVNVGEGKTRSWSDSRQYGFIAAGGNPKFSKQLSGLQPGDIFVAYVNRRGYVGVGIVEESPIRVRDFRWRGQPLLDLKLEQPNLFKNANDEVKSEYLVKVRWKKTVGREDAKWRHKAGLFTTRLVRASLAGQTKTVRFLESAFGLRLKDLVAD